MWDLARQKLGVTSTASHFEMDPWWQLLGEHSDVSISLSEEIARGSTRSPWANQTPHKAQMDALSPACCCWGGGTRPRCSVPHSLRTNSHRWGPILTSHNFTPNYGSFKRSVGHLSAIREKTDGRDKMCFILRAILDHVIHSVSLQFLTLKRFSPVYTWETNLKNPDVCSNDFLKVPQTDNFLMC